MIISFLILSTCTMYIYQRITIKFKIHLPTTVYKAVTANIRPTLRYKFQPNIFSKNMAPVNISI